MTINDATSEAPPETGTSAQAATPVGAPPLSSMRPRRGPALVVLGVVAFITIGGIALAALSSAPKPSGKALGTLHGTSIPAISAAKAVAQIAVSGNPPTDVATALVLPDSSSVSHAVRSPANLELYSGSITLNVAHAPKDVVDFYRLELAHRGWKILRTDATADGKGTTTFATFPSADGFYWEVKVVVDSTSSAISPALGGGTATADSRVSLQLVELNDQD